MRIAAVLAAGAVVVAGAAAAPRPHVEHARLGSVEAVFSYTYNAARFRFAKQHLAIRRAGVTRFAAALRRRPCPYCELQPANFFSHTRSVSVRDLDGDGEPEVILDLYWGGAHCCWFTQIYRYLPGAGTYRRLTHIWWNPNYELRDLDQDRRPEFVTGDDRFSYAFGSFADSRWPIRILSYRRGSFTFVTRSYPHEIGRNATGLWREARTPRQINYGSLAAWTADECMLGQCTAAFGTLENLRRRGQLRGAPERPRAYIKHLRRFLRHTGYL